MGLLSSIGKDAGVEAAQTLDHTVDDAIPAAQKAIEGIEDHAIYGLSGIIADLANRLNGAECPVDLTVNVTIKVTGKIGALKLSTPGQ